MEIGEFLKDNSTGIMIGAVVMGAAIYLLAPPQMPVRGAQPESFQQQLPAERGWQQPPRRHPWFPGAPRNPSECLARGGTDVGTGCRGWH